MTPREVSAWLSLALEGEARDDAKFVRLVAVATQGDANSIDKTVRTLIADG